MPPTAERDPTLERHLLSGTTALMLLSIIAQSPVALYGYQIAKAMERAEGGQIGLKQGTIYPQLRSMEGKGLLASTLGASESGPPRKYYAITAHGRDVLESWKASWSLITQLVDTVMEGRFDA